MRGKGLRSYWNWGCSGDLGGLLVVLAELPKSSAVFPKGAPADLGERETGPP
jgi:hypothetical protein